MREICVPSFLLDLQLNAGTVCAFQSGTLSILAFKSSDYHRTRMRNYVGRAFIPQLIMTFHELGLDESILKSIDEFGFKEPTPIQAGSIPHILQGRDVIGSAQTGTGKTAAYALPILHRLGGHKQGAAPRCLVLGPTRELAAQVEDQFASYGKYCAPKCCLIHGGVGYGKQIDEIKEGADVVIATPGRLLDHLQQKNFDLKSVEVLVLDEVDRMLDMGFIDDVQRIIKMCNKNRQTLLFSATVSEDIKRLVAKSLKDPVDVTIGIKLTPAETVKHVIYPVGAMQKFDLLIALIEQMDKDINTFAMRLKEWFAWHFPELTKIVNDNTIYARLVNLCDARRDNFTEEISDEIAAITRDEEKAGQLLDAVKISMGMDINDTDALQIKKWAERVTDLIAFRETLSEFLKHSNLKSRWHCCM